MNDENHVEELMERVYDDAFDDAYASFSMRRQSDPSFTREYMEGLLSSLYVQQGNNWDGRGQTRETAHCALIAAAELVVSQWDQLGSTSAHSVDAPERPARRR